MKLYKSLSPYPNVNAQKHTIKIITCLFFVINFYMFIIGVKLVNPYFSNIKIFAIISGIILSLIAINSLDENINIYSDYYKDKYLLKPFCVIYLLIYILSYIRIYKSNFQPKFTLITMVIMLFLSYIICYLFKVNFSKFNF